MIDDKNTNDRDTIRLAVDLWQVITNTHLTQREINFVVEVLCDRNKAARFVRFSSNNRKRLASIVDTSRATITTLIFNLKRKGWVTVDPDDGFLQLPALLESLADVVFKEKQMSSKDDDLITLIELVLKAKELQK